MTRLDEIAGRYPITYPSGIAETIDPDDLRYLLKVGRREERLSALLDEIEEALSSPFLGPVKPAPILGKIVTFRALEAGRAALEDR